MTHFLIEWPKLFVSSGVKRAAMSRIEKIVLICALFLYKSQSNLPLLLLALGDEQSGNIEHTVYGWLQKTIRSRDVPLTWS